MAEFVVTTSLDENDGSPDLGDGLSLREAIFLANSDPDADLITFASGVGEAFADDAVIRLTLGELVITSSVDIDGTTAGGEVLITGDANGDDLLIDGTNLTDASANAANAGDNSRVLSISGSTTNVTLDALTLTGGVASGAGLSGQGGGLLIDDGATLLASDIILSGNLSDLEGGGVANLNGSTLTLSDSIVSNNVAGASGGGLFSGSGTTTVIQSSTLADNSAGNGGSGGGGGISASSATSLTLTASTLSGNEAVLGSGGGILSENLQTTLLTNTTLSGNSAGGDGGGLATIGTITVLANATLSGNDADGEGGGLFALGGLATLTNTLVLGNSAPVDAETSGATIIDGDGNVLAGDPANVFAALDANGGGLLADNGGPVQTIALLNDVNNPALDVGVSSLETDARGENRDEDFPGNDGGLVDAGAFEFQVNDAPVNTVPGPQETDEEVPLILSAANGNALSIADEDAGDGDLTTTLLALDATLTVEAGGTAEISGNGTSEVTVTGTVDEINAAIGFLSFNPNIDFSGDTTLTISTNDNGNSGDDGPLVDTDIIDVTVNDIQDILLGTPDEDILTSTPGSDLVTLLASDDTLQGTLSALDGDIITDFLLEDQILVFDEIFATEDLVFDEATDTLSIDADQDGVADAALTLQNTDFSQGLFVAIDSGDDTIISFENIFDVAFNLSDGLAVSQDDVNGIVNQALLNGGTDVTFDISVVALGFAEFNNTLGVYEVDAAGNIVDVRIIVDNVNASAGETVTVSDVEPGNTLGLFIIQDGANFAAGLADGADLSFVNAAGAPASVDDGPVTLAVDGVATSETTFHTFDASLNSDGLEHVVSGVDPEGETITVGFEDLTGLGDQDFEDVVITIDINDPFTI